MIIFSALFPIVVYIIWFAGRRVWILVYKLDYSPQKVDFKPLSPTDMSLGETKRNFLQTFLITLLVLFFSAVSGGIGSAIYQPPKHSSQTSATCTAETNPPVIPPFTNASETFICREVKDPEIFNSFPDSLGWLFNKTINSPSGLMLIMFIVLVVEIFGLLIYWNHNRKNEYLLDELYGSFQTGEKDPKLFGPEYREELKKNLDTIFKDHPAYKEMNSVGKRLRRIDSRWPDRSKIFLFILYLVSFSIAYAESGRLENGFTQVISTLTYILLCIFFIMLDQYASRNVQKKKKEYLLYAYRKISARRDYIEKALNQ